MRVAWCKPPSARWQLVSVLLCSLCTRGLFLHMPKCIATSYSASAIVVIFLSLGLQLRLCPVGAVLLPWAILVSGGQSHTPSCSITLLGVVCVEKS